MYLLYEYVKHDIRTIQILKVLVVSGAIKIIQDKNKISSSNTITWYVLSNTLLNFDTYVQKQNETLLVSLLLYICIKNTDGWYQVLHLYE